MNSSDYCFEGLAVSGAPARFIDPIHVGRPNIGDRERLISRFNQILDRRWLTNNGECLIEFEHRLAKHLNVKHSVAMCNATVALEILIRAVGLTGEVIVPSYTFIATAHALQWQEITPVFCDIDPLTHNIDPSAVEAMITPRTTGIIGVHVWGRPCNIDALAEIAQRRKLTLIFDAAHAFGVSYKGRMIGGFGKAEVLSFHATKFFNTMEGGAVCTNDDALADRMRLMRNFGFAGYDKVVYLGTNGKMNEMSAAMGLTSFESLDHFISTNRRNYEEYRRELAGTAGISLLGFDSVEQNNFQYIVLEIDHKRAGLCRDELVGVLWAENCLARRYFWPGCHNMEPYRSLFPHARLLLPHTEAIASKVLLLPTGSATTTADIRQVCNIIKTAICHAPRVRERLAMRDTSSKQG